MSTNGDVVAWRTWRRGRPGTVRVGRVQRTRVRRYRTAALPSSSAGRARSGNLFVGTDGLVALVLPEETGRRGAVGVWEPDAARTRAVGRVAPPADGGTFDGLLPSFGGLLPDYGVAPIDSANLLVAGALVPYRAAAPGRCPTARPGTESTGLGGWRLLALPTLGVVPNDAVSEFQSQIAVCTPSDGRTQLVGSQGGELSRYGNNVADARRAVRVGDALLLEFQGSNGGSTSIRTSLSGPPVEVPGPLVLDGPDNDPAVPQRISEVPPNSQRAVAGPGYVAWITGPLGQVSDRRLVLHDARGTRDVGPVVDLRTGVDTNRETADLRIEGDTLRWNTGAGPAAEKVQRRLTEPYDAVPIRED